MSRHRANATTGMRPIATLLAAFVFGAGVYGCAPATPGRVVPPGLEEKLLGQLAADADAFRSATGLVKIRVQTAEKDFSGTQVLLVQKPAQLRAEVLNPFGQTALLLATDGTELAVQVPGKREHLSGPAEPAALQRFLYIPLRLTDLVGILLYQVPVLDFTESRLEGAEKGQWRLTLLGANDVRQEFLFDAARRLVAAEYYLASMQQLGIRYGGFSDSSPAFPASIRLSMPEQQVEAVLTLSDLRINQDIPPDRFRLIAPAGFAVKPLP